MAPPQCQWTCSDPTCDADCKPFWETIPCTCENAGITPVCNVSCSTPYDFDQCPVCEIRCTQNTACGTIQCEQLVTSWACRKPSNCPSPTCQLNCASPTCPYNGSLDPWLTTNSWWILWLSLGVLAAFFILNR